MYDIMDVLINLGIISQYIHISYHYIVHFKYITIILGGASGKEPTCQCRRDKRHVLNPWLGRSLGGWHGSPLQYSCLENPHGLRSLAGYGP